MIVFTPEQAAALAEQLLRAPNSLFTRVPVAMMPPSHTQQLQNSLFASRPLASSPKASQTAASELPPNARLWPVLRGSSRGWGVPERSSWFDIDAVHAVEKGAMPDFFPTAEGERRCAPSRARL